MANGPALSTSKRGVIYVGSEIRDSLSLLDVLHANQFEGETLDPDLLEKTEVNFYRGAPPEWLNFHFSEQAVSEGIGTPLIKRHGYDALVNQIRNRKTRPGLSTVKLFHQPGCGGTTLAMQVLWDLRKTFRCAALTGSSSDITKVAEQVAYLFTAGSRDNHNTVLLLLNDEHMSEKLQESIMMKMAEQQIVPCGHVAILLSCVRKNVVLQSDHVFLQNVLSEEEEQKFNEKEEELSRRYSDRHQQFHGFNIMKTNFDQEYVEQACTVFRTVQNANRPPKTQLSAFLSLLNAYVPGSYLLESQCLNKGLLREDSHLIITFPEDTTSDKKVRMAHPMIAQCCSKIMAEAGVTRSDTARKLLKCFCRDEVPPFLLGFVKDMLTKREMKKGDTITSRNTKEGKELFSQLILDIKSEDKRQSVSVLELASRKFKENPFFPQALARFYYLELQDYNRAEIWAKTAKLRDPQNSFVADTLGQVHKNHLKRKKGESPPTEILQLATNAIDAFKDEERLAENELDTDMNDGMTKVSKVFNIIGQFGYLQVCNLVYDLLVSQNETWRKVLTKNPKSFDSDLKSLGDNKLNTFSDLIKSLGDEVERKCAFVGRYLTFSKPHDKDDPSYLSRDESECYWKYVRGSPSSHRRPEGADSIQERQQNPADTSAGTLCLHKEYTEQELKEIAEREEKICLHENSVTAQVNYIYAQIMLRNTAAVNEPNDSILAAFRQEELRSNTYDPEFHMLALLLSWPTDSEEEHATDLSPATKRMRSSYERVYKKYFQSRYLQPLFFIGKGQGLNRIIHRKFLEEVGFQPNEVTMQNRTNIWSDEKIFQGSVVQEHLLKVEGVVRNYRVYATTGGQEIEVDANLRNSLWKPRQVWFYIGFNIRGPVAFGIQTKTP